MTWWALIGMTVAVPALRAEDFFELPPIKYSETASEDAISKWTAEIARGDWVVPVSDEKAFLREVLNRLNIPVESQVLVFSKTSLQNSLINRLNPRALYYSDEAYLGWVPGGKIEVIIDDENLGPVFYALTPPTENHPAKILRVNDTCLQCHGTTRTERVPGMLVRSVVPDQNSHAILSAGTSLITDSSKLKDRWGGWYVTGTVDDPHLGNRWVPDSLLDDVEFPPEVSSLKDLTEMIDTGKYLLPTSDVVSLMVLEHQCHTHNLLTKGKLEYRQTRHLQLSIDPEQDPDDPEGMSWRSAESSAKKIVEAFLFTDEVEIRGGGIEGGEGFAEAFVAGGVRSREGRSLRDFRLYERIFKYRCSYMIYSKAFRSLPKVVKDRVFFHLRVALSDEGAAHLGARERKAIQAILTETIPGFGS